MPLCATAVTGFGSAFHEAEMATAPTLKVDCLRHRQPHELLVGMHAGRLMDSWAVGLMMYKLLTGREEPFASAVSMKGLEI